MPKKIYAESRLKIELRRDQWSEICAAIDVVAQLVVKRLRDENDHPGDSEEHLEYPPNIIALLDAQESIYYGLFERLDELGINLETGFENHI